MIVDVKEQRLFMLQYNLLKLPEFRIDDYDTFWVDINVLADNMYQAREKAELWLQNDGHKVYLYESWVGFRENGSGSIIT